MSRPQKQHGRQRLFILPLRCLTRSQDFCWSHDHTVMYPATGILLRGCMGRLTVLSPAAHEPPRCGQAAPHPCQAPIFCCMDGVACNRGPYQGLGAMLAFLRWPLLWDLCQQRTCSYTTGDASLNRRSRADDSRRSPASSIPKFHYRCLGILRSSISSKSFFLW